MTGRMRYQLHTIGILLGICICFCSCRLGNLANVSQSPSFPAFRRPSWWAFYRRALNRARNEDWDGAREDLRTVLGDMPGAIYPGPVEDQRRAKTYGLHFLDDYFPHRELGVCYFFLADLEAAERELRRSLDVIRTSRAMHYLNEVHREKLKLREREGVRHEHGPQIHVEEIGKSMLVATQQLRLTGTVDSPNLVAKLTVAERPVLLELAAGTVPFTMDVQLHPGSQKIRILAEDLAGKRSEWVTEVISDVQAPRIDLSPSSSSPDECLLTVDDDLELSFLSVNGIVHPVPPASRRIRIDIATEGLAGDLVVKAKDTAGNPSALQVPIADLQASLDECDRFFSGIRLAAASWEFSAVPPHSTDSIGPQIRLFPEIGEEIIVTSSSYLFDMLLHDKGGLASLEIEANGETANRCTVEPGVMMTRSAIRIALNEGVNEVKVTAKDRHGNGTQRNCRIVRRMDCLWRHELRMGAVLMPIDLQDTTFLVPWGPRQTLLKELLLSPRRLRMVDRDADTREQTLIERLLNHQAISTTSQVENIRPMVKAEWILQAYTTRWSGRENWDMVVNVIDTDSGEIILTTDIHAIGTEQTVLATAMQALADKIRQRLPALSAPVIYEGDSVCVAIGTRSQIVPGMRFLFLRGQEMEENRFSEPLQREGMQVQGYVEGVERDICHLRIRPINGLELLEGPCMAVLR